MVLEETAIIECRAVLERTTEDITKYARNVPRSSELGTDGESLVVAGEIETSDIHGVIGVTIVATHIVGVDLSVTIEVNKYGITWIEFFYELCGERLSELFLIVGLGSLIIEFPELVLRASTDAVSTSVHIFILLGSLTVLDDFILVIRDVEFC